MRKNTLTKSLILVLFFSCSSTDKNTITFKCQKLFDAFKKRPLLEKQIQSGETKFIILIPTTGCAGCIDKAVGFYNSNQFSDMFFVFTRIIDHKLLNNELKENGNLFLDITNSFSPIRCIGIYPIVISTNTKEMIEVKPLRSIKECLEKLQK